MPSLPLINLWDVHDNITQAVTKMSHKVEAGQKTTCILEIGDKGIKMVDKSKPGVKIVVTMFQLLYPSISGQ